jgi:quinohemoprotein ethanol dehydrogenase
MSSRTDPGHRQDNAIAGWAIASAVLVAAIVILVAYLVADYRSNDNSSSAGAQASQSSGTGNSSNAGDTSVRSLATAPAFTAKELTALPTQEWITNGGSLSNQRYSPLDEISTDNVSKLKGVWLTHLKGSGTAAKYSAEAQPLVYNGVIYVPTGEDDVFAVDVATGKIRWRYDSKISQKINTVCCGWLSRGVAIGEGKVYIGQLDGNLVALDQKTGKVAWKTAVGSWRKGYTITAAPLYYDGRVIIGGSGGEFSIRGRLQAYDAKTGKLVWRFHTTAAPGETGSDSWPKQGRAWQHGGAPVWQTPAVDPELGMLYFSTGNASPDLDGSNRAGNNLFTASIVALDAKTGKYRWHFQQVHHDIWDYDSPSPVVLFDAKIDGQDRKALAETSKTGWTYVLDRQTGKPLLPVKETKVPQDKGQKTAPTQPIPGYAPFIPHQVTEKDVGDVAKIGRQLTGKKTAPKVLKGNIFDPFGKQIRAIIPGPQGGVNWQPMSYNQKTGLLYICAMRSVSGYSRSGKLLPKAKQGKIADVGSVFTTGGFGAQTGYFGAWNPASGKIEWQKRWPESCYSGTVSTAGGLVFVGRNTGELQAYGADDGKLHWSFQTGAGANSTVTVFEHQEKEYVALLAGGNALAASPHGDNLWLFSLDGTLAQLKSAGTGKGTGHAGETPATPPEAGKGNAAVGRQVFENNCSGCHGLSGKGGNGGPSLASKSDYQRVIAQVRNGGGGMPAFKDTLTPKQQRDVAAFVTQKVAGGAGK